MSHPSQKPPRTTRAWRQRYVRMLKVEAGEIDPPGTRYPSPPKPTTQAQRKRIVEAHAAAAGLRRPRWRSERRHADTIDVAPIKVAWDAQRRARSRRFEAAGLSLENHGSRARCRRCGEVVMDVPNGLVGAAPSALRVWHAQRTGCR